MALLMAAALCLTMASGALADTTDLESTGEFRFSVAINGNFEELNQEDHRYVSTMEMYVECPCGSQDHEINTTYTIETAEGCPYAITAVKKDHTGNESFMETIEIVCDSEGRTLTLGYYPFTLRIAAECAEYTGTGVCEVPLRIREGKGSLEDRYGYSVESIVKNLDYFTDVNYDRGDSNMVIWFVQTALDELEYYDGVITGSYGNRTRDAIQRFQRDEELPVTGRTDAKTMARLFGAYLGKTEVHYEKEFHNPDWSSSQAWLDQIGLKGEAKGRLIDLWTDIALNIQVLSMDGHINAEPYRAPDTRALCRIFGVNSADEIRENPRPMLLVIEHEGENIQIVCSVSAAKHQHDNAYVSQTNEYSGHFCLYLNGSPLDTVNPEIAQKHQDMIKTAVDLMTEKVKSSDKIGNGDILKDEALFENMPPVETPTLILPDGGTKELSSLLNYRRSQVNDHNTITYNVHMQDREGEEQTLLKQGILCFPYPEGLDQDSARKYHIIIHHDFGNGKTEVFKSENGDIEFRAQGLCIRVKSFSPFRIAWEDASDVSVLPGTGDNSLPVAFLLLMLAVSLGCLGLMVKKEYN